uniref:VWFA domain-containing protein n=1 Tax=Ciona savignyi TaxID=51511 RepID=H2YA58_CIOSA
MDFVFALDSSTSTGAQNWINIKNLVIRIISNFSVTPEDARFSVFRFNRRIDRTREFFLNTYAGNESAMVAAIQNLPYRGWGSYVGRALRHARDVSLAPSSGNRVGYKDVILTVTDGRTYDDALTISNELRNQNVTTYAVGVEPVNGRTIAHNTLLEIAGRSANRFLPALTGFDETHNQIIAALKRDLCA